jgi:hypothetical protein
MTSFFTHHGLPLLFDELDDFVTTLAHRVGAFPAAGHATVKNRVNAISLAPLEDFRRDSDLFAERVQSAGWNGAFRPETRR